jgi:hypothetical protein
MNNVYYLYVRYYLHSKLFSKIIWVLNNFLTMECYRKLCNRLYWKKIRPGTVSYKTRCWLIFLSVISAVWMAFFYDPTDPANLNSPSSRLGGTLFSKIFEKIRHTLSNLFYRYGMPVPVLSRILNTDNVLLWRTQNAYLKTSSLLI